MKEYKTIEEILDMVKDNRPLYAKASEELHTLALTKFAKYVNDKGGKIISCSVKNIKKNNGEEEPVVGSYLKYTYDDELVYYIQFDVNPFFEPRGYIEYYTNKHRISTGITDIPNIWNNVEVYVPDSKNIQQLFKNIIEAEKYLKSLSFVCRDKYVQYRDNIEQHIYMW